MDLLAIDLLAIDLFAIDLFSIDMFMIAKELELKVRVYTVTHVGGIQVALNESFFVVKEDLVHYLSDFGGVVS